MTRSTAAASARFRQRKLSTKHPLQILRECEIDHVDDEAQRNVPKVETGVEKGEEIVSFLQCLVIGQIATDGCFPGGHGPPDYPIAPEILVVSLSITC